MFIPFGERGMQLLESARFARKLRASARFAGVNHGSLLLSPMKAIILLVIWISASISNAPARADVLIDWQGNDAGIIMRGTITIDTLFELSWAAFEVSQRRGQALAFVLDSPGGSVAVAQTIGLDILKRGAPAMVMSGSVCASACFVLLASAPVKLISPDAIIGIHSAQIPGRGETRDALATTSEMAKHLSALGIPDALVGKLVRTPASELSVLTSREIETIPGAKVLQSVSFRSFTKSAIPVDKFSAGYAAGAYIAAGRSTYTDCDLFGPVVKQGCEKGLKDAPPEGWAKGFFKSGKGSVRR